MLPTKRKTLGFGEGTKGDYFLCEWSKLLQGDLEVNGQQKRDAEEKGGVGGEEGWDFQMCLNSR